MYSYKLLIEDFQKKLLEAIHAHQNVIVKGPTGCGKSTFVPLLLKGKNVAIIEPRRIAVTSLFNTLKTQIENIGYKMRFNKILPSSPEECRTMIFTDGSFLADLDLDYDYIIIDEVHERSVRTDILLAILKQRFQNKLILMSATLETDRIQSFFNAKLFEISGASYPLQIHYLESPTTDYIVEAYLTIKGIVKSDLNSRPEADQRRDILVFLPGSEDIRDLYKLIQKIPSVIPYKIYSAMSDVEQNKIYEATSNRKVILSTNICETSLTIPTIKYVIDTGLFKNKIYSGVSYLGIQCINRDSAVQRMGRCNRLGPGICYKLYTQDAQLPVYTPEILRSDLTTVLLHLISIKIDILSMSFIDSPPLENVLSAVEFLLAKGCIEVYEGNERVDQLDDLDIEKKLESSNSKLNIQLRVTSFGKRLAAHPFDTHLANFYEKTLELSIGYYGNCILSLVSLENYNFLSGSDSYDIIALIRLMEKYRAADDKYKFCISTNIPFKGMERAYKIFKTLNKTKSNEDLEVVERVFSRSFDHNLCVRQVDGSYKMVKNDQQIFIHPSSGFFKMNLKKIVVVDIFYTTKMYARVVGRYFGNEVYR